MITSFSRPSRSRLCGAWVILLSLHAVALAQTTLDNPAPNGDDHFGFSAAIDGDLVVVGARFDSPGGVVRAGSAYVFDATAGNLIATLNNPAPTTDDFFGQSVAIAGDRAVVGAINDNPGGIFGAGTAYVFDANTGNLVATLNNPAPEGGDSFGKSVGIAGNLVVVGASLDQASQVGTAYVFDATTGDLVSTIDNPFPGPTGGGHFGSSVAIAGDRVLVGAPANDPGSLVSEGEAYVFDATTGDLLLTLNNPEPTSFDVFGNAVAIAGNLAVVGTQNDDPNGVTRAGTVYVFDATTGDLLLTLNNPAPAVFDAFGVSVSISGDRAVVGATGDDPDGVLNVGTAYLFDATTGDLLLTLNNPEPTSNDRFGNAVAIDGDRAVVGAFLDNPGGVVDAGAAYVFVLPSNATPTGTDVSVLPEPVDELGDPIADAPAVTFDFDLVTGSGETTVTITESGPPPPSGFKLIGLTGGTTYFDLDTTANFAGFVEICIDYSDLTVAGDPANLKFAHNEGGTWVDKTSSNDTMNRIICAMTSSFSFFAIVEIADPITLLADLVDAVAALNAKKGIINNLDAKLGAAERALTDAIENNDFAAMNVLMNAFINATEAQRGNEISDGEADDLIDRAQEITLVLQGVAL